MSWSGKRSARDGDEHDLRSWRSSPYEVLNVASVPLLVPLELVALIL